MNRTAHTKPGQVSRLKDTPPRALGRRDRRKIAVRAALLDAARSLLVSRSMDALSVDEIVERADVARGTFYNYFPDKDALERELASNTRARVEDEIARVNNGITDPARRIARAFVSVLRLGIGDPQQAVALMRLFPHATDPAAPINAGARRDAAQGLAHSRIAADSEDVVVAYVMGVISAGLNRVLDLPSDRVHEFARGLGALLLHGLGLKRVEAERIMREAVESVLEQP